MKASKRMNIWGQLQAGALAALSLVACDPGPTIGPGPAGEEADTIVLTAEETAQAGIRTHPAIVGTFKGYRDFPAIVQPNANRLADITTLVRGRVTDIYVDLGADVKTGQLLARLQSPDLAVAQSVFLKGQAREHEAQLVFERARDLYASKAVSLAEFQRRDAEFATARAESRETRHRLQLLGMRPQEIDQLARDERIRSDVEIRAPFDGRILARTIARGEIVETTDKLFTLADLSDVWVLANVPEKDVRGVHRDHPVEARLAAYPGEVFTGRITYVGDVLDPATRTMKLRMVVPNPDRRLKPEMFGKVRLGLEPDLHALMIPATATQRDQGKDVVFVQLQPGRWTRRTVRLGEELEGFVQVLEGLHEGEHVVTDGAFRLKSELAGRRTGGTRR
jgi:cobalt-zinc-cadmium efflux system membrane fusion protein